MTGDNKVWTLTFVLWGIAMIPLYWLWQFHFPDDTLDTFWGLVLYVVAGASFLLLWPINAFANAYVFPPPPKRGFSAVLLFWLWQGAAAATFVVTLSEGFGRYWWGWLLILPVDAIESELWPWYWLVMRPMHGH